MIALGIACPCDVSPAHKIGFDHFPLPRKSYTHAVIAGLRQCPGCSRQVLTPQPFAFHRSPLPPTRRARLRVHMPIHRCDHRRCHPRRHRDPVGAERRHALTEYHRPQDDTRAEPAIFTVLPVDHRLRPPLQPADHQRPRDRRRTSLIASRRRTPTRNAGTPLTRE